MFSQIIEVGEVFSSTVKKTSPICNPASEAAESGSIASTIGCKRYGISISLTEAPLLIVNFDVSAPDCLYEKKYQKMN